MDSSSLVASIDIALDKLLYQRKQSTTASDRIELGIIMRWLCAVRTFYFCSTAMAYNVKLRAEGNNDQRQWLCAVRTFCFCSTTLAYNVELRAECNNDNAVTSLRSQKKKMKEKRSRMRKSLGSLLVRVEDFVGRILDGHTPSVPSDLRNEMGSCDEEMDEWYASWSVFLKKYSTSSVANQIKAIEDSVFEDLKDFPSSRVGYYLQFEVVIIESLKKKITIMRKIICFGTLLCTENQVFQCPLTQIEPLAISAEHLAHRLFSNTEGPVNLPSDLTSSILSALLFKFNPLLHEKYTLALPSLKHSGELCDPTLDLSDYPFIMKMEHCIVSLSSTFLEMLQLGTLLSLKDFLLYERLRLLRILLKRQPDRFNDVKIRNLTAAIVGDAGVRIFSFYLKDSVTDHWLQCVLENSEVIWEEVLKEKVLETSTFNFSKTNILGFIDFLLEDYLVEVNMSKVDSNTLSCVPKIREHLVFLKSFMGKLAELRNQQENLHQDVWNRVVQMVYKIEFLIDQLVLGDILDSFSLSLQSITEDMVIVEADSLNLFSNQGRQEIFKVQQITCPYTDKVPTMSSSLIADEIVGFGSEKTSIVDRLVAGLTKLQVVAVVGMPGLGKTTLATKVYKDSFVTHHFHVKAWCSISQVFDRRKVLLQLLNQIQPGESNSEINEYDLSLKLWRSLKKRRYLIFIDDVWDTKAFDLLKESLPDDSNQSRILLTSRHDGVVPEALLDDKPLFLRHLTVDESMELLRRKLFPAQKDWPLELHETAMEIAKSCKGLPLTVVIVAGLLRTTDQEGWKDVLKTLRSSIISDVTGQCESTLELSYKHLPNHLKPCFLWFGAFPEDHEYSVKRMIWLWISDGLIRKNESKSLEDVGRDYMNTLIARSLIMNGKGRSVGGVKTCRIHDLLHDFCMKKANEEFFLHVIKEDNSSRELGELSSGELEALLTDETEILGSVRNLRRLSIYCKPEHLKWKVFCPRLRSLLFHSTEGYQELDISYIFRMFKLLRVLGIDEVELTSFPSEIGALVQLRYLEIRVDGYVGPAIGNLSNLETLILTSSGYVVARLPDTLWNLRKLSHLYFNRRVFKIGAERQVVSIELPSDDSNISCNLLELQTLCALNVTGWSVLEKQLRKFPNICRLRLECDRDKVGWLNDSGCVGDRKVMDLSFLSQLESLSLRFFFSREWVFPENIKKLSLWGILWDGIASIAKLPNLEVLYGFFFFVGDTWHMEEGEFQKLKFLKLRSPDLVKWTAAPDDVFPNLEKLVLDNCPKLEEVPECLYHIQNLDTVEVIDTVDGEDLDTVDGEDRVVSLLKSVVEFQKEMGNLSLQFHQHDISH